MTNTPAWNRLAAEPHPEVSYDVVRYGPDGPTERELRLIGDVRGKRVLDLGCGSGQSAISIARQGAVVIAVDASRAQLERAFERAEAEEVRVEWKEGDLADLAFLRADSIDLAFSAFAIAEVDDIARLFRQVQRVLKANASFVFSYEHPMSLLLTGDAPARSYFDRGPVVVTRDDESLELYVHSVGTVFTELGRAGFRVDTIAEPRPPRTIDLVPSTIVWRARKEGS